MNELPTMSIKPGQSIETQPSEQVTGFSAIEPVVVMASTSRADQATITLPYITNVDVECFQDEAFRIDLKRVTRKRLATAKALRRGMVANSLRMADGSEVKTNSDAIYCLLDMLSAKMEAAENK